MTRSADPRYRKERRKLPSRNDGRERADARDDLDRGRACAQGSPDRAAAGGQHRGARAAPADRHGHRSSRSRWPAARRRSCRRGCTRSSRHRSRSPCRCSGPSSPAPSAVSPETATALLRDVTLSLAKKFRAVALVNVNQEPANLEALKKGAEEAKKAGGRRLLHRLHEEALVRPPRQGLQRRRPRRRLRDVADDGVRSRAGAGEGAHQPPADGPARPRAQEGREDVRRGRRRGRLLRRPHRGQRRGGRGHLETLADILTLSIMEYLGARPDAPPARERGRNVSVSFPSLAVSSEPSSPSSVVLAFARQRTSWPRS